MNLLLILDDKGKFFGASLVDERGDYSSIFGMTKALGYRAGIYTVDSLPVLMAILEDAHNEAGLK